MAKRERVRPEGAQQDLFVPNPAGEVQEGALRAPAKRTTASPRTARLLRADAPEALPTVGPFLKWAGGKNGLMDQLEPLFPVMGPFARYFEPFVGGGAVFFALSPRRATLSDLNPELINSWIQLRDDVEGLITALQTHAAEEEHYYAVRALDPTTLTPNERAARFMFLNRTCFNGLHRVNKRGQFNVPFGKYANPTICDAPKLRRVSAALRHCDIRHSGYEHVLESARPGDFVYFDPPYEPVSATANFTSYTNSVFGRPQQEQLAATFRALDERGVNVMLSNSNAEFIRNLYAGYDIQIVLAARNINRDAEKRGAVEEVVVRNYR